MEGVCINEKCMLGMFLLLTDAKNYLWAQNVGPKDNLNKLPNSFCWLRKEESKERSVWKFKFRG